MEYLDSKNEIEEEKEYSDSQEVENYRDSKDSNDKYKSKEKENKHFPPKEDEIKDIIEEKIIYITGDIIINKYKKGKYLGSGGFASCFEIISLEDKKVFACKIMSKKALNNDEIFRKAIIKEIKIHKKLYHPNIIKFYKFFEDSNFLYLIIELCKNKSLRDIIKGRKRLTELEVQCILIKLIDGLRYLHTNGIIHRDLKLNNIFLDENMEVKMGDFGLAVKLDYKNEKIKSFCGTLNYMAPEIFERKGYSYEIDIWALGIIMCYLLVGKNPFQSSTEKETINNIKNNKLNFPKDIKLSSSAKDLINQILTPISIRPSLDQILCHDFFKLGISIPKSLEITFPIKSPNLEYIRKFMPKSDENGIVDIPLTTKQLNSIKIDKPTPIFKIEDPIWIKKYYDMYDYSIGFIYYLSNGCMCNLHKDGTKTILDLKTRKICFIENEPNTKKENFYEYTLENYPIKIQEKVLRLQLIIPQFEENKNLHIKELYYGIEENCDQEKDNNIINEKNKEEWIYLKYLKKSKDLYLFFLNNNVFQFSFCDKTKLILSPERELVSYFDKHNVGKNIFAPYIDLISDYKISNKIL